MNKKDFFYSLQDIIISHIILTGEVNEIANEYILSRLANKNGL